MYNTYCKYWFNQDNLKNSGYKNDPAYTIQHAVLKKKHTRVAALPQHGAHG